MKIVNNLLYKNSKIQYPFISTHKHDGVLKPELVIIHFTSEATMENAVRILIDPFVDASAHVVIGRDGRIIQLVPFNLVAWHAGLSLWQGKDMLNRFSIGLELDNAGRLTKKNGQWVSHFGGVYHPHEVLEAHHKNELAVSGWHKYTKRQMLVTLQVCMLLKKYYGCEHVLGHDDISPSRKIDPGPAFPMKILQEFFSNIDNGINQLSLEEVISYMHPLITQ